MGPSLFMKHWANNCHTAQSLNICWSICLLYSAPLWNLCETTMPLHCEHISSIGNYYNNNNIGSVSGEVNQPNERQPFTQTVFYLTRQAWIRTHLSPLQRAKLPFVFYSVSTFMGKINSETLTVGIQNCAVLTVLLLFLFKGVFSYCDP